MACSPPTCRLLRILVVLIGTSALLSGASPAQPAAAAPEEPVRIVVINTSDEHGWLEPFTPFRSATTHGGAPMIYAWWVAREGYDVTDDRFLLLSGGDSWTGPALSTWFAGKPMTEVMHWMGYDASAVGNHEFDFGRATMQHRFAEAGFPYLSANMRVAETGKAPDFVRPYVILPAGGVPVGVVGLTTVEIPRITSPAGVSDLVFLPYEQALGETVPRMREEGARVILVLTHACVPQLLELARTCPQRVDAYFAGHCHGFEVQVENGIPVLGGGWAWRSYARLTLTYDRKAEKVVSFEPELVQVAYPSGRSISDLEAIIAPWQERAETLLGKEIGYLGMDLPRGTWIQASWVVDSWLHQVPDTDVAVTNVGGLRQTLTAGPLTVGDVVGLMPFENNLVIVSITGRQLAENLETCGGAVGGIRYSLDGEGKASIQFLDGSPFDPEATYRVVINDFMYAGGDGYLFGRQDPEGYNTGIQWRQPVLDWTESLHTSPEDPLEKHLDPAPRGPTGG